MKKIAYTRIDQVVSITDVIENTITGIKGIGGLQTRTEANPERVGQDSSARACQLTS